LVLAEGDFADFWEAFELELVEDEGFEFIFEVHGDGLVFVILDIIHPTPYNQPLTVLI
jgi:hypothetical protein